MNGARSWAEAGGRGLTGAQRRALRDADPRTGELHGHPATLAKLVGYGLARTYGPRRARYLTPTGWEMRTSLLRSGGADRGGGGGERGAGAGAGRAGRGGSGDTARSGGFVATTGDERVDGPREADQETAPDAAAAHAAAAARAWEQLLEIRRITNTDLPAPLEVPAEWERHRMVHAVALALEAAGVPPAARAAGGRFTREGYRVTDPPEPAARGAVRVEWRTAAGPAAPAPGPGPGPPAGLALCARELEARGWTTERYLDAGRRPYLVVAPRSATYPAPAPRT
ncbi:hypothetical protein ACWGJ2_31800 [Streptomyces sp. NPDC054796]